MYNKNLTSNFFINYVTILHKIPILTLREEKLLILRLRKENDMLSAHYLIISHLCFVLRIAKTYLGYGILLSDLLQEGTIGLMKSIKNFNPIKGNRLVSYAVYNIKAEINEYIIKNWSIVKVATTKEQRKLFFNSKITKKNINNLNKIDIEKNLFEVLNVSTKSILLMQNRLYKHDYSLDDHNKSLIICTQDIFEHNFEQKILTLKLKYVVKIFLKKLDFKSNFIIKYRWFVDKKISLRVLGVLFNVSTERVRQIEKNILNKLAYLCLYLIY